MAAVLRDFHYLDFRYVVGRMGNHPEFALPARWLPVIRTSVAGQPFPRRPAGGAA